MHAVHTGSTLTGDESVGVMAEGINPCLLHLPDTEVSVVAKQQDSEPSTTQSLMAEFRRQRRDFMTIWGPTLIVLAIAFIIAAQFVQPAPPKHVMISTGSETGGYHTFAQEYAHYFKDRDITLEPRTSAGSVENVERLLTSNEAEDSDNTPFTGAIVQGGVSSAPAREKLRTVASLYLEPVWVFYRGDEELTQLRQLKGKTIAAGVAGSGTQQLAITLLQDNGVLPKGDKVAVSGGGLVSMNAADAAKAIKVGEIDVAIFVISPHAPMVRSLIADPDVQLMSFNRHSAYPRRHRFISSVTLPRGVLDPAEDLPSRDVHLIAPAANLVVHEDIHSALIPLFIEAARSVHDRGGLVTDPGEFPSLKYAELPIHDEARRYFQNGPSALHRILPFWLASFIERSWVMVLPLLTLLLPLFKIAPPVYRWRIRVRIYRWYRVVRAIDKEVDAEADPDVLAEDIEKLRRLENEVAEVQVPLSYMEEFYNLRLHIAFVHRHAKRVLAGIKNDENKPSDALDAVLPKGE